jgi:hypothetical protein
MRCVFMEVLTEYLNTVLRSLCIVHRDVFVHPSFRMFDTRNKNC